MIYFLIFKIYHDTFKTYPKEERKYIESPCIVHSASTAVMASLVSVTPEIGKLVFVES